MHKQSVKPQFSVVIPNWNGRVHLPECLSSLRRQTFRNFETILVDNGSTDDSLQYVETAFQEVRILRLPENLGFAAAVNHGIKAAAGDFLVLLNNDTEVEPDWLQNIAAAALLHPDVAIFASKLMNYYHREVVDSAGDGFDLRQGPYKIGEGQPSDNYREAVRIFGACGGGGCYKREVFETIGMFDEEFFAYFEDTDLSFRANWAGFRCLFVPDAIIYHKVGGTSDSNAARRDRFDIMRRRNFIFMVIKNYPLSLLLKSAPFILSVHFLVFLGNLLRRRFKVAFLTQWQIVEGFPVMLRKRHNILATRRISNEELVALCSHKCGDRRGYFSRKLGRKFNSVFAS